MVRQNSDKNFIRWRTVACPNDVRPPSAVMTCNPNRRLPIVARHAELSANAVIQKPRADRQNQDESHAGGDLGNEWRNSEPAAETPQEGINDEGQQQGANALDANVDYPSPDSKPKSCVFDRGRRGHEFGK